MIPIWRLTGRLGNQMFQMAYLHAQMRDGLIPDIYVQSPEYFEKYSNEIKAIYGQNIVPNEYIAIHVRRGDYVGNSFYVDLMETDYYKRAMLEFPNEKFMVFSDDIDWCKKQDIFEGCTFSESDEVVDLNKIAGSKGVIMANSSFSWWGAYLNGGKIIAPQKWYSDSIERTKLLKEWKRI